MMKLRVFLLLVLAGLLISGLMTVSGERTRPLPFLSIGDDADDDGVPDSTDVCNGEDASFFDRDGDGCIDDVTGTRHTEYWDAADLPFVYYIHEDGSSDIADNSEFAAIQAGVEAWTSVVGADFAITYGGTTPDGEAVAGDGINTVTFSDTDYDFGQYVLAVGVATSYVTATQDGDKVYRPGQIIDADMIFNPAKNFKTATYGTHGTDIQSVATHEAGHLYGLSHSAVKSSTMFFVLPGGTQASSLEAEDEIVFAKAYPGAALLASANRISGTVTNGLDDTPLPGAIVFAIDTASDDTLGCEYTFPDGSYSFFGLPDGSYYISVYPLDGTTPIGKLKPGYINSLVESTAVTLFVPEYYSIGDTKYDDPSTKDAVSISGGSLANNIDIVTNIDDTGPTVVLPTTPSDGATGERIDTAVLLRFSESIDVSTIRDNFRVRDKATGAFITGSASVLLDDSLISFTPSPPYLFSQTYVCSVKTGLKDKFGNSMTTDFVMEFGTEAVPPISISSLVPNKGVQSSVVVINGAGFGYTPSANTVIFPGPTGAAPIDVVPNSASPNGLVVTVPEGATTGEVKVVSGPDTSNGLTFTILSPAEIARGHQAGLSTVGGVPRALTVTPSGNYAYVATSQGVSSVVVNPGLEGYLNSTDIPIPGGTEDLDAIPNSKRIYAVSRQDSSIHVINSDPDDELQFNNILASLFVRTEPLGIIVGPSGRKAYVATTAGKIQVWDVFQESSTYWKQIGQITPPDPNLTGAMMFDPAGERLLALSSAGDMHIFHIGPDTLLASVAVGTDPQDVIVDPAGQRAYISDGFGVVSIVALGLIGDTPVFVQDINANGSLRGLTITPTGQFIYAANRQLNTIDVIDLNEGTGTYRTVAATIEVATDPVDVALSPDGFYAFSITESNNQFEATVIGLGPTLTSLSRYAGPVNTTVVLEGSGFGFDENSVRVNFTGAGGTVIPVKPDQVSFSSMVASVPGGAASGAVDVTAWSPDVMDPVPEYSNALFFKVLDPGLTGLFRHAAKIIPGSYNFSLRIEASPIGDQIAFNDGYNTLILMDIDPESPTFHQILTTAEVDPGTVASPYVGEMAFTPDGKRLYISEREGTNNFCFNTDRHSPGYGDRLDYIFTGGAIPAYLAVSPNGEWLLSHENSRVAIIDINPVSVNYHTIIDTIAAVGGLFADFEFHPSGNYFYAMQNTLGIRVVDMRQWSPTFKRVLNSVPLRWYHEPEGWLTMRPISLSFTPDGQRCVVSAYNGSLIPPARVIFTLDTSNPEAPVIVGRYSSGLAFLSTESREFLEVSPAGDRVLYHNAGNGFMYFRFDDPDTNLVLISSHPTDAAAELEFAPDGSRVYAVADIAEADSISIYDFNGGDRMVLQLTSGSYQAGVVNQEFAAPLRVRVMNQGFGYPISGVAVNFVIDTGGGYFKDNGLMEQVVATDSDGYAEVEWVYGPNPGCGQVIATARGLVNSPRLFICCAVEDPNSLPLAFADLLPTHQQANVSATTSILASFSRGVDPATVTDDTYYLVKNGETTPVPVVYGFTDGNRKVSMSPSQPLDFSTLYNIEILNGPTGIKDLNAGELNTSVLYEFTTQNPPPLVLTSVSPPSAVTGVKLILTGTGFDPVAANNTVYFNSVSTTPIEAGIDYLKVVVPTGAVSGLIHVETGGSLSNDKPFTVIVPTTAPIDEVLATVGTGAATRSVVMTPDGALALTVSPEGDKVIPIDVENELSLNAITVGDHPISIAMHPEGTFAYVANFNSNSVSVISVDPDSSDYLSVRTTIIVGANPIDVAVGGDGEQVAVANSGAGTLSIIDGDNQSSSFHSVLATLGTGASTRSVTMAPDGSRIYIGTDTGYIVMDANNYGVLATVGTGASTRSVTMAPDGTMLIVLTTQGEVIIYNVDPNAGEEENSVLATLGKGSSTRSVTMNPDGTLLYLIQDNSNTVLVVALDVIGAVSVIESGAEIPPFQVTLTVIDSLAAGENPSAIAFDPSGSGLAIICNAGDRTVTLLNASSTPAGPLAADICVTPRTLNLSSRGRWVTASIELPGSYVPEDIDISTVLLQDTVPAVPDEWEICDCDLDGVRELVVKFDRALFQAVMPLGEYVPVTISGLARTRAFSGEDTIRTIRPQVLHPTATAIAPGEPVTILWSSPAGYLVDSVDVHWSPDDGESWECIAHGIPDDGNYTWAVPNIHVEMCRIMVTLYSGGEDVGMGMSPMPFSIDETVAINLASFDGIIEGKAAVLSWKTTRERNVHGFHLLRSDAEDGLYERITEEEIHASGVASGGEYRYEDGTVKPNRTYFYKLEEVGASGDTQLFGPCKLTYIARFALEQNVPNPFNPATTIHFTLPENAVVKLVIYDVAGRIVRTLVDEKRRADNYEVTWDGRDMHGDAVASGVYFYRISAGKHRATRKMVLLK